MGQRTKCPHDSDEAPIINAADDYSNCSHRRTENGPAGASGTMPFSEFVFSSENFMYLQPYGRLREYEQVRLTGQIVPVLPSLNASGDTIHFQHLVTILVIIPVDPDIQHLSRLI
jgi:hypothetical protein